MTRASEMSTNQMLFDDPYESFMRQHLQHYGYFTDSFALEKALITTRQLVVDFLEGKQVPRLREPRSLYAVPTTKGPLQPPRWPIECEVIKEEIHHIDWVPPEPEKFYQSSGQERTPQIVGEEKGSVVYYINPGKLKGSYFTCSRVGGCRYRIKPAASIVNGKEEDALLFESRFESGNLQKAVRTGRHDYELTLQTDLYTNKHTQWFYFRVQNMKAGVTYRFTIVNLMKPNSLYNMGMKPLLYSKKEALNWQIGWKRMGSDIRYYKKMNTEEGPALYSLTWTCQFPHDDDTCYFAHCYPYTYSDLQRYLLSVANDTVQSQFCKLRVLCRSLAGNMVYLLTITSPSQSPEVTAAKKAVVITARVHPGETNGSWMMQGFLDFLLSDSPDAKLLRDTFIFKVVPMLNPDGVIVGNYRCSLAGRDLNRSYKTLLKDSFPCVWHTRNMVKRLLEEREVVLYCDFHGHSRKNNVFMYGCNNKSNPALWLHERVFPLMLSKNAADKFSFKSCKFKIQKSKEGTGRIVMWKMGIANSYTMESTFSGSTLGRKKGTHFTTQDLKSLGYHFCDTLLDFCDPDSSKFMKCLSELHETIQQELRLKLEKLGKEVNLDATFSDYSLSELESSTSGSNSSESDGLPAHLLNVAEKLQQKKKKRLKTRKERNKLREVCLSKQEEKLQEAIVEPKPSFAKSSTKFVYAENLRKISAMRKKNEQDQNGELRSWIPQSATNITVFSENDTPSQRRSRSNSVKQSEYLEALTAMYLRSGINSSQLVETVKEMPHLQYSSSQSTSTWKEQYPLKNISQCGQFEWENTFCSRPWLSTRRHRSCSHRCPLHVALIQQQNFPAFPKDAKSPIKQHPPPFDDWQERPTSAHVSSSGFGYRRLLGILPGSVMVTPEDRNPLNLPSGPIGQDFQGAIPKNYEHPAAVASLNSSGPTSSSEIIDTTRARRERVISSTSECSSVLPQKASDSVPLRTGQSKVASIIDFSSLSSRHPEQEMTNSFTKTRPSKLSSLPELSDALPISGSTPLGLQSPAQPEGMELQREKRQKLHKLALTKSEKLLPPKVVKGKPMEIHPISTKDSGMEKISLGAPVRHSSSTKNQGEHNNGVGTPSQKAGERKSSEIHSSDPLLEAEREEKRTSLLETLKF
ncbi:cytosolic carboxypeptidase 2 [Latimeria chalumnae]|uniref:cytosolic carboxypeptidase 2 n=1 Tax=Latimeria chalumnae TaxID=7897 RepID=UPI00313CC3F9